MLRVDVCLFLLIRLMTWRLPLIFWRVSAKKLLHVALLFFLCRRVDVYTHVNICKHCLFGILWLQTPLSAASECTPSQGVCCTFCWHPEFAFATAGSRQQVLRSLRFKGRPTHGHRVIGECVVMISLEYTNANVTFETMKQ